MSPTATTVRAETLLKAVRSYLPDDRVAFVEMSLEFAAEAHKGQSRKSGEPYIEHPIATAEYLARLRMDATTIAAALLHDVIEDCDVSVEVLEARFGAEVAKLVDGVTKMSRIDVLERNEGAEAGGLAAGTEFDLNGGADQKAAERAATLRKMFVAMAHDVRVLLIKLADRLHNMLTLKALSPDRQLAIARETLDIYAPLAHRLGMGDLKWRLEDEAFKYLHAREYKQISRMLSRKRAEREAYVDRCTMALQEALEKSGIQGQVTGRAKHLYSIFNKMDRYGQMGRKFSEIYDLIALRVIVETEAESYAALGVAHSLWRPIPGQFDDYIASPKDNMYQSLHTSVVGFDGYPLEVQIRTQRMHEVAEQGVAAHVAYKEGGPQSDRFEQRMSWLKQLLDWQRDMHGDAEYLETIKTDILGDTVFVYTPRGDVIELAKGATPLDFAYRIHTELGHNCVGAMVNGKLVTLNTEIQNGDTVEIKKSKNARGPSLDWLNPSLGYLGTASAREKVRNWFRRQERTASIERGRDVMERSLRHLSVAVKEDQLATLMGFASPADLFEALGTGHLDVQKVIDRLSTAATVQPSAGVQAQAKSGPAGDSSASGVVVMGAGNILTKVARCCLPVYGDPIIGYLTRGRGVSVHRENCPNIRGEDEPERLVEVAWGHAENRLPVRVRLDAYDRVGLLRDITSVVSAERVNIHSISSEEQPGGRCTVALTVYTTGIDQLGRLFAKLGAVRGVSTVDRTSLVDRRPRSGLSGTTGESRLRAVLEP
ncbi:MAG: bifunctional (p)ppGpp synthetase/guanosine-3',5'-bis(diphosphate) 3'-pyrophosphohydrolase [SAR202 cluster bacterium]|nr:bifunctional (p)ppGpp synthetase/guanosine-3',5'-bis(diphosphate) 3'-pyrophosphohydrolase [SAR202 cluster bacterium]